MSEECLENHVMEMTALEEPAENPGAAESAPGFLDGMLHLSESEFRLFQDFIYKDNLLRFGKGNP